MSTQVSAVLPDVTSNWELDYQGATGPLLFNGEELLRILPRTYIFSSYHSWVGFLSSREARKSFLGRLSVIMKAFSSEESVLYPNIGYEMELVGDLSIDRELSFQEIALYLEDKHRGQELTGRIPN